MESPPGVPALARLPSPTVLSHTGVLLLQAAGGGPALPSVRGAPALLTPSDPFPGWRLLLSFLLHLLMSAWASVGCSSPGHPSAFQPCHHQCDQVPTFLSRCWCHRSRGLGAKGNHRKETLTVLMTLEVTVTTEQVMGGWQRQEPAGDLMQLTRQR